MQKGGASGFCKFSHTKGAIKHEGDMMMDAKLA
jgi:hypothetical protein